METETHGPRAQQVERRKALPSRELTQEGHPQPFPREGQVPGRRTPRAGRRDSRGNTTSPHLPSPPASTPGLSPGSCSGPSSTRRERLHPTPGRNATLFTLRPSRTDTCPPPCIALYHPGGPTAPHHPGDPIAPGGQQPLVPLHVCENGGAQWLRHLLHV